MNSVKTEHAHQTILALSRIIPTLDFTDRKEITALSDRIALCNSIENKWETDEAINFETGEEYPAKGTFWNCNSKLCPTCTAESSRRARKLLVSRLSEQQFKPTHKFYFPTLTIKNPQLPLIETRELINRAWTLLRKRAFWCDTIIGGFKSEEFTLTANGYHYHLHLLIQSRFILFNEFRRIWTECVQKAFREKGIDLDISTRDKMLIVRFETVHDPANIPKELCKYITKTDSWSKVKKDDLKQLALVRRWHRTREFFGTWQRQHNQESDEFEPIVHKSDLSDGAFSAVAEKDSWRDAVFHLGNERYLTMLRQEFDRRKEFRKMQLQLRWREATFRFEPTQLATNSTSI
jgi:hypothetical protein